MSVDATVVIYGKHPAYGDFLAHGLDHALLSRFDSWLEHVLPALKQGLGDDWEAGWAAAPPLVTLYHGRDVSVEYARNGMAKYRSFLRRALCTCRSTGALPRCSWRPAPPPTG